jgi:hypothetical protein
MSRFFLLCTLSAFAVNPLRAAEQSFDRDPAWESINNHLVPDKLPTITQDFGFAKPGQIGGQLWRSTTPAWYAAKLDRPKTLDDRFTASGAFTLTASSGSSGVFFGFFNSDQPGGSRPLQSLGLDFDGEKAGARLAVRLITESNQTTGTFITPFIPGKFRPTPIRNDGTHYAWTLMYDSTAANNAGQFTFTIKSDRDAHEEFETKTFTVDVPPHLRKQKCVFDRFGLMNLQRPGHALTIFFSELKIDGQPLDLSRDPRWEGVGNRRTFEDRETSQANDFGFSKETNHAGGKRAGEIGGTFWRTDKGFGSYADKIGPFTLDDRLEIRGKVNLTVGAPDSAMYVGFFGGDADPKGKSPADSGNFLGLCVEGPTRMGHYFRPCCTDAKGEKKIAQQGPVLFPRRSHDFTFTYDATANAGNGSIAVTLDKESMTFDLKPGQRKQGARLDRFGLFTAHPGGGLVKIFFDDLTYSK